MANVKLTYQIVLENSWRLELAQEFEKSYFARIKSYLEQEKTNGYEVFPQEKLRFNALNLTPFEKVKVVIIGQDPYHNFGQAHGLSFSVPSGVTIPPSLRNIYKELERDLGINKNNNGNLESWAFQGVLLLNVILSVRAHEPASHSTIGWASFTDTIISSISAKLNNVVFMLWGKFAQEKVKLIDTQKHLILTAAHPSPLSAHRGFIDCNHFSITNRYLVQYNKSAINW